MPSLSSFYSDDSSTSSRKELVRALLLAEQQAKEAEHESQRLRALFDELCGEEERRAREAEALARQRAQEEEAWAQLMEQELLSRQKTGGGAGWQGALGSEITDVVALDALMATLAELEKTKARLAEMRRSL